MREKAIGYLVPSLVVVALLFGMAGTARADSMVIVADPSFENAGLADGQFRTPGQVGGFTPWSGTLNDGVWYGIGSVGPFNPADDGSQGWPGGIVPDGAHVAFAQGGGTIFQGVGSILAPNTQFTFGVQAGLRDDVGPSSTFELRIQAYGNGGAVNDILVAQQYTISNPGFQQFYLMHDTDLVGYGSETLVITMRHVSGGQINFDDVTLSYMPLPEPGTLSLLGVGLLLGGFGGFWKRFH